MSKLESALAKQLQAANLGGFAVEFRFGAAAVGPGKGLRDRLAAAGLRDWRFDFAWVEKRLACEVEGGIYIGGRHSRGKGFDLDCRKYAAAQKLGWTVLRVTGSMIKDGSALELIEVMYARDI